LKKTYLLILLLLFLVPKPVNSQVLLGILFGDKLSSDKFHLGVNIGLNLSNLSGLDGTGVKAGLPFGLLGEWRFAEHFYLQPELLPFYKVGANDLPPGGLDVPPLDSLTTDKSASLRTNYFAIPIIVKYALMEDKLHLGLGPQIGFLTSASQKYEGVIVNEISVTEDIQQMLNSTDAGLVFHFEYKFRPPPFGASVAARFYLGLTDTIKDNPGDAVYNRVFSILATIPIAGHADEEEGAD
jgi:hypothetical protein